ncbi:MAG: hypothetical protein K2Q01_01000 [Rickettsiales bacterium]|nr:hypothetical protein [Rickettsiales bacterium]
MADDKKPDEEYKGISSTTAMWGGRATIEGIGGTVAGIAVGLGAAYTTKKFDKMQQWATWGSYVGGGAGLLHGSIADSRNAAEGEKQFALNQQELKTLRSHAEQVLEKRNAAPAVDDKGAAPKR